MYKLSFFVPDNAIDEVKAAIFKTGAGKIGEYDQCCWQIKGQGQFRPLSGSVPHIGVQGQITSVEEWKVELVCDTDCIQSAVRALQKAHPYEEVAYDVVRLECF